MADFALREPPKLISRKIWEKENSWIFHRFCYVFSISSPVYQLKWIAIWQTRKELDTTRLLLTSNHYGWSLTFNAQCGNFRIFLSFRFCVKSILEVLEVQKMSFCHILGLWSIDLGKSMPLKSANFIKITFHWNQISETVNVLKCQILHL